MKPPGSRSLWRSLVDELVRLNRARLDEKSLANLSHREKTAVVKGALNQHHRQQTKCC
jgi:hypothetical protein